MSIHLLFTMKPALINSVVSIFMTDANHLKFNSVEYIYYSQFYVCFMAKIFRMPRLSAQFYQAADTGGWEK